MKTQLRRFGVLAPPGNTAMELELPSLLPAGVTSNHNRLSRPGAVMSSESLTKMAESVDRAAFDLAQAYPEIILYGCTSGSFLMGRGNERSAAQKIFDVTGIPSLTTSTAVLSALEASGIGKLFLITPYPDDINEHEVGFLNHYGIQVAGTDSFRCPTSEAIRQVSSAQVAALALGHAQAIRNSDGLFLSCTNLLTMDQIAFLEGELGKPVISSNQASLWAILQHMGIDTASIPAGSLFGKKGDIPVAGRAM